MLRSENTFLRALSPGQWILVSVALLIVLFLILGTLNQSVAPEPQFAFGLQTQPFLVMAFLSFVAGLLSFASPCTLPILPAYFAFAFQSSRTQIAITTAVFLLGLGTMFSLMGASASAIGRVLLQNQQFILLIGGSLVLGFGVLSLLGKGFSGFQQAGEPARRTGLGGAYLFGMTFAVGWSSCVGPILGAVLTMAAVSDSVLRGVMLGFIYALGLGLPLILVSTFFGRASRQSLFWRLLRGKGRQVTVHVMVVGLVWALAVWRILAAAMDYAFRHFDAFAGQQMTAGHEVGLLAVAVAGVALWIFTGPAERKVTLYLHSTQLISGALFVLVGILLLSDAMATFNNLIPIELALWFAGLEERLIVFFSGEM
jgi:cytochrome c-type biogenesis protein